LASEGDEVYQNLSGISKQDVDGFGVTSRPYPPGKRVKTGDRYEKRDRGAAIIVTICSASIAAQWPKHLAPDVPRDAEGRVRMDAPTPRTPDGKPDLSGNWSGSEAKARSPRRSSAA